MTQVFYKLESHDHRDHWQVICHGNSREETLGLSFGWVGNFNWIASLEIIAPRVR